MTLLILRINRNSIKSFSKSPYLEAGTGFGGLIGTDGLLTIELELL